ncbi:MAG TPA: Gfo/Idh/MocA family oxidoreductase, partial [Chitinophagaceae bacterium]
MKKKELKAGIIGCGFAANFHFDALQHVYSAKVEIVGAYSRDQTKLMRFTDEKGIIAFDNLNALIRNCDVLHVCTAPVTHEPITVEVLKQDKDVIIEKPFTGYFGNDTKDFNGDTFPRETGLEQALLSIRRMLDAEKSSKGSIMYAENWVYAPAIRKEREIIEKTGAQVLWIQAEESHSGSHSRDYGQWCLS